MNASAPTASHRSSGSVAQTEGIHVTVRPAFIPEQSSSDRREFVFAYHITIANEGESPATLLTRHWRVIDADGVPREISGEGVVGHQPTLAPGELFEYASFCVLRTRWGTMEGSYEMHRPDGSRFHAAIERFYLVAPAGFIEPEAALAEEDDSDAPDADAN